MDTEQQEASETLLYNFDYPMITECWAVKITAIYITVFRKTHSLCRKFGNTSTKYNTVYWKLSCVFYWPDTYTYRERFLSCQEMIEKCLQSYSYLISKTYFSPHSDWFNSIEYYKNPLHWIFYIQHFTSQLIWTHFHNLYLIVCN